MKGKRYICLVTLIAALCCGATAADITRVVSAPLTRATAATILAEVIRLR